MKKIVTQLKINHDTNGNPRSIWIVNGLNAGLLISVYQGHYSNVPDDCSGSGFYLHGSLNITVKQYWDIIRQAKSDGIYHL